MSEEFSEVRVSYLDINNFVTEASLIVFSWAERVAKNHHKNVAFNQHVLDHISQAHEFLNLRCAPVYLGDNLEHTLQNQVLSEVVDQSVQLVCKGEDPCFVLKALQQAFSMNELFLVAPTSVLSTKGYVDIPRLGGNKEDASSFRFIPNREEDPYGFMSWDKISQNNAEMEYEWYQTNQEIRLLRQAQQNKLETCDSNSQEHMDMLSDLANNLYRLGIARNMRSRLSEETLVASLKEFTQKVCQKLQKPSSMLGEYFQQQYNEERFLRNRLFPQVSPHFFEKIVCNDKVTSWALSHSALSFWMIQGHVKTSSSSKSTPIISVDTLHRYARNYPTNEVGQPPVPIEKCLLDEDHFVDLLFGQTVRSCPVDVDEHMNDAMRVVDQIMTNLKNTLGPKECQAQLDPLGKHYVRYAKIYGATCETMMGAMGHQMAGRLFNAFYPMIVEHGQQRVEKLVQQGMVGFLEESLIQLNRRENVGECFLHQAIDALVEKTNQKARAMKQQDLSINPIQPQHLFATRKQAF